MIAIDLRKQQELNVDPKPIQQISFTGNQDQEIQQHFLLLKKQKKIIEDFSKRTVRVLKIYFALI